MLFSVLFRFHHSQSIGKKTPRSHPTVCPGPCRLPRSSLPEGTDPVPFGKLQPLLVPRNSTPTGSNHKPAARKVRRRKAGPSTAPAALYKVGCKSKNPAGDVVPKNRRRGRHRTIAGRFNENLERRWLVRRRIVSVLLRISF